MVSQILCFYSYLNYTFNKLTTMNIFSENHLLLDIDAKNQNDAFEQIAKKAVELGVTNDPEGLVADFIKREQESTTGMSDGVAIPHAMNADFLQPAIIVARFKEGIEWNAVGGKPVRVAFALLIPANSRGTLHMKYLQNIAIALLDVNFNEIILNSISKQEIIDVVTRAIERKDETEIADATAKEHEVSKAKSKDKTTTVTLAEGSSINSKGLIVGVSSCATGVAHTYMAREALEKHAKDVGYDVWIETQGQSGREHQLTDEMIQKAVAVVIASDINVDLERFIGKKIYKTNTNEAINAPVITLEKTIMSNTVEGKGTTSDTTFGGKTRQGGFMKHFLNGVSHMIPFIVFSGIIYAILNAIVAGGVHDNQGSAI
jgi:PTS system fructose-specific IIC component